MQINAMARSILPGRHRLRGFFMLLALAGFAVAALPGPGARAEVASWIVVDMESGGVISQKAARRQWYPASITKLMTAYVTFKAMREGRASARSVVTVSANAHAMPPSKMGFKPGTRLTLDSALKMVIVKSANDVAVSIAESVGGSEPAFIELMNAEARRLGMSATHFVNPHGLPDPGQISSARDLALLARTLWREFPEHRHYFQVAGIRVGNKVLKSANREFLARVPGANGMKTGYVCNSGLNVVVSATRGGRTVLAVVLGAASGVERAAKARELIDDGFDKRGGRSVEQLTGVSGGPPPDGYCKRNPRPTAEELLAAYGNRKSGGSVLAFVGGGISRPPALQGISQPAADAEDDEVPQTAGGKTDWAKVMDEVIGPRQRVDEPLRVSLGVPADANSPKIAAGVAAAAVAVGVPIPGAPMPQSKPALIEASAAVSGAGGIRRSVEHGTAAGQAAPGAIFRGKPLVLVPRPLAAPRP
ncbi:D-alanyl-D-alanine carboxypeptidase family protein [Stappia sp. ICDLI1TA098]